MLCYSFFHEAKAQMKRKLRKWKISVMTKAHTPQNMATTLHILLGYTVGWLNVYIEWSHCSSNIMIDWFSSAIENTILWILIQYVRWKCDLCGTCAASKGQINELKKPTSTATMPKNETMNHNNNKITHTQNEFEKKNQVNQSLRFGWFIRLQIIQLISGISNTVDCNSALSSGCFTLRVSLLVYKAGRHRIAFGTMCSMFWGIFFLLFLNSNIST